MRIGRRTLRACGIAIGLAFWPAVGPGAAPAEPPVLLAQGSRAPETERGWDRESRLAIQDALVWTGDYDGRLDGAFGPRTREAIRGFQRSRGFPATGYLTSGQYYTLMEARNAAVDAAGYRVTDDPETGIRVGIARALLQRSHRDGPTVVYRPTGGDAVTSLALISMPGGRAELRDLHGVLTDPDVVEDDAYTVLRDDFLVVSDEKGGTVTYTYVRSADGALKGFTLAWPESRMDTYAPIATAMFNSFRPIPGLLD